jgi:hypothetical protein
MKLNIQGKFSSDDIIAWQLFDSAKADYVVARTCLQTGHYFLWPGFQLIQQSLENFIKAILKNKKISWPTGIDGHDFIKLLEKGSANGIVLFKVLLSRADICNLLKELQAGYNFQRYGESGHFIDDYDEIMDLFDEIVHFLLTEFSSYFEKVDEHVDSMRFGLPVPEYLDKVFSRRLKQPFIFISHKERGFGSY